MSNDDAPLDDVLAELAAREPIFHRLELGTSRAEFEAQTSPDFWEVGASGTIYDRETVWSVLETRYADSGYAASDPWETSAFVCRRIAPDTYLLTHAPPGRAGDAPADGLAAARGAVADPLPPGQIVTEAP